MIPPVVQHPLVRTLPNRRRRSTVSSRISATSEFSSEGQSLRTWVARRRSSIRRSVVSIVVVGVSFDCTEMLNGYCFVLFCFVVGAC